jgi:predicted DNA-binding WGR domain protein
VFKLYSRTDDVLHYREAWEHDLTVVEHWGVCGDRGDTTSHDCSSSQATAQKLLDLEKAARESGYGPISSEDHVWLVVEFELSRLPFAVDPLRFRHRLEDLLNELTGWLGLGHCDGGSIGSGTLEAACMVVDYGAAARALERELASSDFKDYSRIYQEGSE